MRRLAVLTALLLTAPLLAEGYKLPPKPIVDAVAAATSPEAFVSPARDRMLLVEYEANPPLEAVARPMLRLAGTRIDPGLAAERRTWRAIGLSVRPFDGTPARRVAMPAGSRFGSFEWSPDGRRFAFLVDREGGCELWVGDAAAATARAIPGVRANDVLGRTLGWARDGRRLLVSTIPASRGAAPAEPAVPSGPVVEETAGRKSQMATFEDLQTPEWAERARNELARIPDHQSDGLTPTEDRVARLAADGLTNGQIAERLFLSPKTVEVNLTRIYRKLGVRRAALATRLAELGDVGRT